MSTKPATALQPSTPLPWVKRGDEVSHIVSTLLNEIVSIKNHVDAAYIVEACNAYPQLIEDRKRLMEALTNLLPVAKETCNRWPNDDCYLVPTAHARILLAELETR